ncbi:hypothetical protein [Mycoplasmopsis pullorum]|uniref:Major capsid protein n=1 Tax=Mycoplasmopsis pullorum TaxID=48003 RepID=A0A1L4FSD2_9BACT|nr:hypothetical protein [Mycoplasmopsis pullorum]APJ38504.1 hypothetical protein BLA55_02440 [Mycoplasmopsis pullorum]
MADITLKKLTASQFQVASAGTTGKKLTLNEQQGALLMAMVSDRSLLGDFTKGVRTLTTNELGIQVQRLQIPAISLKTGVGAGTPGKFRVSAPVVVNWNQPFKMYEAYTAAEKTLGKVAAASSKLELMLKTFARACERSGFEQLEQAIKSENAAEAFDWTTKPANEIYSKIVDLATEITELYDAEQGIDLIDRENIVIHVKPRLFDKIAQAGMIGNRVDVSYELGQYGVSTIGGYVIKANPFLRDYEAIIGADFAAAEGRKVLAANAGSLGDLSNDEGAYFEGLNAFGVITKKVLKGIYKTANKTTSSENYLVTAPKNAPAINDPA